MSQKCLFPGVSLRAVLKPQGYPSAAQNTKVSACKEKLRVQTAGKVGLGHYYYVSKIGYDT